MEQNQIIITTIGYTLLLATIYIQRQHIKMLHKAMRDHRDNQEMLKQQIEMHRRYIQEDQHDD